MSNVMEFVVSDNYERTVPLPLNPQSPKEIVVGSYRHLVIICNDSLVKVSPLLLILSAESKLI